MDKQKQIEEIKNDVDNYGALFVSDTRLIAKAVFELGYRKIPENSFNTLHEKQLEKESKKTATITEQGQADWLDGYKVGFRDGVVALRTQTVEKIDEICKELTEDKV